MRYRLVVLLALAGPWYAMLAAAQLPVPPGLLESRLVYVTGRVPEREWLN